MATLTKSGITTGQTIQSTHVTQIIDALTKSGSYDLYISGSTEFTGSVKSYNGFTGSLNGTADTSQKVEGLYGLTGQPVTLSTNFKFIGGAATIPNLGGGTSITVDALNGKTLGTNCFVSIACSSSVAAGETQVCVDSLNGNTLTFKYRPAGGGAASKDLDFFYTILYTV